VATEAGASNINRLTFRLSDEGKARAEALARAARQARDGAEALASTLKLKLGKVLRVEEEQPVVISPAREVEISLGKAQGAAASPVEAGSIEVHANVNMTFELLQ
jgi:uncharacterized protein YggE